LSKEIHGKPAWDLTIHEARAALDAGQLTSQELTASVMGRIEAVEPTLKAFVTVTGERAMEQARRADDRIAAGEAGPLTGIPLQLKDNMSTRDIATTCSSRMLENFVPPYDATVTARLQSAGAVLVGKGNMDEFAMGSSTENSAFFPTHNPHDTNRVPGGSSGGPAAAVSAGEALFSLGSDTGGSIRQPASLCGVVGLKPTYGLVSRYGLVAFASSLDQIGPFTRDVEDAALVLSELAGHDPRDATSIDRPVPDYPSALTGDVRGLKIGVPKEYFPEGMGPGVESAVRAGIEVLAGLGAEIIETSLPHTVHALAVYYIIAPSEASSNLARYDGVKYGHSAEAETMWGALAKTRQEGFGPEVKRRIMLGTYALSAGYYDAYYLKAQKVRTIIRSEFAEAFSEFDLLATPTSPTVAFELGAKTADPVQMYLNDIFTMPANIAGIPAISVPAGKVDGLPVGLQLMAPHLGEETLLRAAHAYERAADHDMRPSL
jgi:aspartyl-tRNA(Asn)/glutamyl-tRNA(Gln) amidotransferase subunit A